MNLTKAERKALGLTFSVLGMLGGQRNNGPSWKGVLCQARHRRKGRPPCGLPADTTRPLEAAPGMWIHVVLCHRHGYVWDQAEAWGGALLYRELACDGACPEGKCRGDGDEPRYHLWLTEEEIEDAHAGVNNLYSAPGEWRFSRCGREGLRDLNTQLKTALKLANRARTDEEPSTQGVTFAESPREHLGLD